MEVNTSASIAAFQAKSAAEKVLSYMWYIHVLVSVNTEARLRAKIALVLDEHSVSPAAAASPEATFVNQHSEPDRQNQQQQQSSHDLTDHLILGLFSRNILSRLVDTAPVFAQADGYACILADVPVVFREEFCRRLYMLLFRRRIVEWPHGIDVPEPAIAATEPVVDVVAPVKVEDTCPSSETEQEDDVGGAALDGSTETMDEGLDSPAASHRPGASVWHQTPSLSSWDGDDIAYMERAAYFGTAANPVPMNYFADWEWSRDGCGPQGGFDEYNVLGERLSAPLPSPQDQGRKLGEDFRTPPCNTNRKETSSPHACWQGRGNPSASVMYGDDIGNHGSKVSRWSSSVTTGSRPHHFGGGRTGIGHSASKQPAVSDEQWKWEAGWKQDSSADR